MVEQQEPTAYANPYKFNAKELDNETGLYYYGARYYNPRISIWYGVDPLAVYNPVMETEFYGDGQHNDGVFFWGNNNPYIYTYQNPIVYVDPNGKQTRAAGTTGYRPGIPIPVFKKGNYYTPFPIIDGADKKVREGFDIVTKNDAKITAIKIGLAVMAYQKLMGLFADKLKPENGYKRGKEHGIAWQEGDAKRRARETGNPQGKWGSQEDLDYAGEKAGTLAPGPEKNGKATPGDFEDFPINEGSTSTVYNPDGTQSKPDKIRVRNNGNGVFHGFPIDSKTAGSINKKNK